MIFMNEWLYFADSRQHATAAVYVGFTAIAVQPCSELCYSQCMLHTVRSMCQHLYLLELGHVQLTPFVTVIALDPEVLCYSSVA